MIVATGPCALSNPICIFNGDRQDCYDSFNYVLVLQYSSDNPDVWLKTAAWNYIDFYSSVQAHILNIVILSVNSSWSRGGTSSPIPLQNQTLTKPKRHEHNRSSPLAGDHKHWEQLSQSDEIVSISLPTGAWTCSPPPALRRQEYRCNAQHSSPYWCRILHVGSVA